MQRDLIHGYGHRPARKAEQSRTLGDGIDLAIDFNLAVRPFNNAHRCPSGYPDCWLGSLLENFVAGRLRSEAAFLEVGEDRFVDKDLLFQA
ncbi:hypothetical protein HN018_26020 (plasmid) [Lichenicola cladoniae]|uniref:Uncharacterized protein n=1 Tax=Lichenicola cladoniae TaxID=1484109 RepID=A0A6M8HZW6_9PROT|nr:hypothetical protein [Lichenicola cladoniae]NPD70076.1 hypothetical protein [Acetobacteraceae bacterium]QKE93621.1 hypothetical protein HN018_26020 [Lichenicola cladoniae]